MTEGRGEGSDVLLRRKARGRRGCARWQVLRRGPLPTAESRQERARKGKVEGEKWPGTTCSSPSIGICIEEFRARRVYKLTRELYGREM